MHTTKINNTTFHHNGDYRGDVHVIRDGVETTIPFEDMMELVANFVMAKKISKLEQAEPIDILMG